MWKLLGLSIKYHWDAQTSNKANLVMGVVGMIVNNAIVLWGLWAMLFDGKPGGREMTIYFLALNGMIVIAWGSVNFFLGGLDGLAMMIEEGSLEPMLATPRHPLLLAGLSASQMPALGDIIQGSLNLVALMFLAPWPVVARCALFTSVSFIAVTALFILMGSIPFFVSRGSNFATMVREVCLSLSFYPSAKFLSGSAHVMLCLTPAAATALLPMRAIELGTWESAFTALAASLALFAVAVKVFSFGLKRYQTASYVTARA